MNSAIRNCEILGDGQESPIPSLTRNGPQLFIKLPELIQRIEPIVTHLNLASFLTDFDKKIVLFLHYFVFLLFKSLFHSLSHLNKIDLYNITEREVFYHNNYMSIYILFIG